MILIDAGPLIAMINRGDGSHDLCVKALASLSRPITTTWPIFTEAMYFVGVKVGWSGQDRLWTMFRRGTLAIPAPTSGMIARMPELMKKFKDVPMDLADASLVALAEEQGTNRIFTLDSDFEVYRLPPHYRKSFVLIP